MKGPTPEAPAALPPRGGIAGGPAEPDPRRSLEGRRQGQTGNDSAGYAPIDYAGWCTTNLVGVPVGLLGSTAFNAHPVPLHIAGTRETNGGLFGLLGRCGSVEEARAVFEHYMAIAFGLAQPSSRHDAVPDALKGAPVSAATGDGSHRWRNSYLKLLQGWGLDANGPAGAVLKGWVESRFGLVPAFHGGRLARYPSPVWVRYVEQKGSSRHHNNSIHQQLDLLYEFCQWMLARFALLGDAAGGTPATHATLWRGSGDAEAQVVGGSLRARRATVRLNNVVSFTRDRDTAGCFGDWVMRARVPLSKLLVVPGLLNTRSLQGESEAIALGGDYEVEIGYGP